MRSRINQINLSKRRLRAFKTFSKSLRSETDRACAVLAVSLLDSMLEKLLRKKMITIAGNELFQAQGPLSSFSAKIDFSFAFGLIAKDEYDELHLLRRIRNQFAHTPNHRMRLSSPIVRDRVNSLRTPRFLIQLWKEILEPEEYKKYRRNEKPRQRFELSFVSIYLFLTRRIALTTRAKRPKGIIEPFYDLI